MFQHALNVSELVLEMVHRVFKEWLQSNPNHDAHLSAVDIALARDWSARLYSLYKIWSCSDVKTKKEAAFVGLKRFLFGAAALSYNTNDPTFDDIFNQLQDQLNSAFREPVLSQMKGNSNASFLKTVEEHWVAGNIIATSKETYDQQEGMRLIKTFVNQGNNNCYIEIKYCAAARLMKTGQYSTTRATHAHNTICMGDVVTIITVGCTSSKVLAAAINGIGVRDYFKTYGIVKVDENVWLIVRRLKKLDDHKVLIGDEGALQVIQMTKAVRRACAIHVCSDRCHVRTEGMRVVVHHDEHKKVYQIAAANTGFPPHMG